MAERAPGWEGSLPLFPGAEVSEELCVSVPSPVGPAAAARAAVLPDVVRRARATLVHGGVPTGLRPEDLLALVPPEPTDERFEVRTGALRDPADPTHGWVAVEAVAPVGRRGAPLRLTVLVDASDSMRSVALRSLPPLQDEAPSPDGYRAVSRLDLAKGVLYELVRLLPETAELQLVVFDKDRARRLLGPTPASSKIVLDRAIDELAQGVEAQGRTALQTAWSLAGGAFDPCADHRLLLITDDNARLHPAPRLVERVVRAWADQGLELWTMSLGLLGERAPALESLAEAGRGVHLYADTRSEAVEPLRAALRASGAVAREPAVEVTFGPAVRAWRRIGGGEGEGSDRWTLPVTVEGGWSSVALYEVEVDPQAPGPWATVPWSVGSPYPGEWSLAGTAVASPAEGAVEVVGERALAAVVAADAGDPRADWAGLASFADRVVAHDGPGRELQGWARLVACASGGAWPGGCPTAARP